MCDATNIDWQQAAQSELSYDTYIPDAAECMRCGVCVGSCPTYQIQPVEQQTPRNRVGIMRRWLQEQQLPSAEEQQQLNDCLQCRACEAVCPSRVAYGDFFDLTQSGVQTTRNSGWLENLAFTLVARKRWRNLLLPALTIYLKSGLQTLVRRSGVLRLLRLDVADRLLTEPALLELASHYPVRLRKTRGRVALFTGCLAEAFDRQTQLAAIRLLNRFGYEVVVPPQQGCCGALHQHHGRSAHSLIEHNLATFYALEVQAVIYTATGCGAMLAEYQSANSEQADWFVRHLFDISAFLLQHWPDDVQPARSNLKVAVHEPCSQRNVLQNTQAVYQLLAKIPGLEIVPLADNALCCGAGGSYLLTHPQQAQQLKALKQQAIIDTAADVWVTSNFGCALHLNADQAQHQPKWVHPIQLLLDRL